MKTGWLRLASQEFLHIALRDGQVDMDILRRDFPPPVGLPPQAIGSVPRFLHRKGFIRPKAAKNSTRKERHSSLLNVWEIADETAARLWLGLPAETIGEGG